MRYPRYPAYKDSGVEWLGEAPAHWRVKMVKYVCRLAYGDALAADVRAEAGVIPVYGSNGIVGTHDKANTGNPVLIVGRKGSFGKIAYSDTAAFCIDTAYFIDQSCTHNNLRWLYYALQPLGLDQLSQDTGVPGLSREVAYQAIMAEPSVCEQAAIAAFLDRETARLDALIARQEQLIALLHEKRQALIAHAVTKGLCPDAPMQDSGVEWLGEIPAHWVIKRTMHLTPDDRQIMYGIVLPGPNVDDGVPIVKGGDVASERLKRELLNRTTYEIEAGYARSRLRGGDIVFAIRGSIGAAELVPAEIEGANLTQDAARIAPRESVHNRWLLYAMKSMPVFSQLDAKASGATIRGINIMDLKRAYIPVPPFEEQVTLAMHLDQETGKIDTLISKAEHAIALLREHRTALIAAAVTGKIDVRDAVTAERAAPVAAGGMA